MAVERLPSVLPSDVMSVVRANLTLFLLMTLVGALFVVLAGLAVIVMPLALGRDGVGRAMITLFLTCTGAVSTGIAALATRSAARVFRRERRGVASLLAFVRFGAVTSAIAGVLAWFMSVAFFGGAGGQAGIATFASVGVLVAVFAFFAWSTMVLSRYRRSLAG